MDGHRLRSVIDRILEEHSDLGIEKKLAEVPAALDACVKNPSARSDEDFRDALDMLLAACNASRTVDMVESDRRIVEMIGAAPYVGQGLTAQIKAIVSERPFLPARAREQFARLGGDVQAYVGTLSTTQASLRRLNVEPHERGHDDYQLAILLPDSFVKGHLSKVATELRDWEQFLEGFFTLVTGKSADVRLRSYSAGSFDLMVGLDQHGALVLGTILGEVYEIFKAVRANRDRIDELGRHSYPKEVLGTLRGYEQQIIQQGVAALKETIVARYVAKEIGRRRDQVRALEQGLRFLLVRVHEGVVLEITGPPPEGDGQRDGPVSSWGDERLQKLSHHVRLAVATASGATRSRGVPGRDRPEHMQLSQLTDDRQDDEGKPSQAA